MPETTVVPSPESMRHIEEHWAETAKAVDGWAGPAPRILSDDDAHVFVEGVMVIAKNHGWLTQDKSIFDWLEERLS